MSPEKLYVAWGEFKIDFIRTNREVNKLLSYGFGHRLVAKAYEVINFCNWWFFPPKVSEIPTGYINNLNPATPINGKKLLKLIHLAIQNWKAITYDAT